MRSATIWNMCMPGCLSVCVESDSRTHNMYMHFYAPQIIFRPRRISCVCVSVRELDALQFASAYGGKTELCELLLLRCCVRVCNGFERKTMSAHSPYNGVFFCPAEKIINANVLPGP